MDEYAGIIRLFAGSYAPEGWAFCHGQPLPVAQYPSLFAVIGYSYGGSGANFNVPNLSNLIPVGTGTSAAGTDYVLGQTGGYTDVTLDVSNLPSHDHMLTGALLMPKNSDGSSTSNPENAYPAASSSDLAYATTANAYMGNADVDLTLDANPNPNASFSIMMPTISMNYIISVYGAVSSPQTEES